MKTRNILAFAACASLIGSPFVKVIAQDAAPAPAATVPAKEPAKKPEPKPIDPEKQKWNEARKKAMEDPGVKAAMEETHKAQTEAAKKLLAKIREVDPSLGAAVDKEEQKLKAREPKPAKAKEPMPKKAADKNKTKGEKKPDEKKEADKPAE